MGNVIYLILFLIGFYYLIHYRIRIEKAVHISKEAIFPKKKEEFSKILIPNDWKEMVSLNKNTYAYKWTHWGTIAAIILIILIFILALTTEWMKASFSNIIYLILLFVLSIHHPGNLFILQDGIIVDSKFFKANEISDAKIEQIVRWHDLYGLNDRVNNSYKLEFAFKKSFLLKTYVVIEDRELLEKIVQLLKAQNIKIEELQNG